MDIEEGIVESRLGLDRLGRPSASFSALEGLTNEPEVVLRAPQSPARRAPAIFTVFQHPELVLSWAASFPDKLKFRKRLNLWPLQFILRADYSRRSRSFSYGCSCKDVLLGGLVSLDLPSQRVEYYNSLSLTRDARLGVHLSAGFRGIMEGHGLDQAYLSPRLLFTYELGGGTAVLAGNAFDIQKKIPLSRPLAVEVCGAAQLPTPTAQYAIDGDNRRTVSVGTGAISLHVAELNVVLFL
eukprot:jgi/Botrbrau1/8547/Bobra.0359s0011.1